MKIFLANILQCHSISNSKNKNENVFPVWFLVHYGFRATIFLLTTNERANKLDIIDQMHFSSYDFAKKLIIWHSIAFHGLLLFGHDLFWDRSKNKTKLAVSKYFVLISHTISKQIIVLQRKNQQSAGVFFFNNSSASYHFEVFLSKISENSQRNRTKCEKTMKFRPPQTISRFKAKKKTDPDWYLLLTTTKATNMGCIECNITQLHENQSIHQHRLYGEWLTDWQTMRENEREIDIETVKNIQFCTIVSHLKNQFWFW